MAKTFKRIAALATAVALVVCFAVSASAIEVATTTKYTANQENVNVTVNVTGAGSAAYVTYYAKNLDGDVVYVDQVDVTGGEATIKYQTPTTSLKGEVKVGYTGAASAEDKTINANTISYAGGTKVLPTEEKSTTITFAYEASSADMKFGTVTADANATVTSATEAEGTITVVLSNITGDVALNVVEKDANAPDAKVTHIAAAAIVVGDDNLGEDPDNQAKKGDRKLTVIGQFSGDADAYGIAVSTEEITLENIASVTKYVACGSNDKGVFAVQLIDEGADNAESAEIQSGVPYYTAIYAVKNGAYVIDASAETVTAE